MNQRFFLSIVVALASGAAAGASACSSSDVTPENTNSGAASDASVADSGAASGEAGATDSGFSELDAAPPDAGSCANESLFSAGFAASCSTCLARECCAEVKKCDGVADCKAFAQCYAGCELDGGGQSVCQPLCLAGKDGGAIQQAYNELLLCGGTHCHNDGGGAAAHCPF